MSRIAFLTRVLAFSQVVPPRRSRAGRAAPVYFCTRSSRSTGHEELVFAGVAKLHELLRIEPDVDPLEADEVPDAVVDMDDEVAGLEVAEVGQERARRRLAALVNLAFFLEDVGLGPELELGFRQAEAAAQMADADEHGRGVRVLGTLHRHGEDLVVGEELNRALGAARPCARRGPSCRRARGRDESPRPSLARGRRTRPPADTRCGPSAGPRP